MARQIFTFRCEIFPWKGANKRNLLKRWETSFKCFCRIVLHTVLSSFLINFDIKFLYTLSKAASLRKFANSGLQFTELLLWVLSKTCLNLFIHSPNKQVWAIPEHASGSHAIFLPRGGCVLRHSFHFWWKVLCGSWRIAHPIVLKTSRFSWAAMRLDFTEHFTFRFCL